MAINSVSTATQNDIAKTVKNSKDIDTTVAKSDTKEITASGEAAVYEKSDKTTNNAKTYTRDTVTLDEIAKQVEMKFAPMRALVENLFSMQNIKTGEAKGLDYNQIMEKYDGKLNEFYKNLQVDDKTSVKAQQEISEEGFWGVKQTAGRAIDFAKALTGGDPSKIELVRKSIEDGYKAAEKSWGGELPEICKQTQEATLKGLDEWANEVNQTDKTDKSKLNKVVE